MGDEEMEERDPVTGLYPFMIVASADVRLVYDTLFIKTKPITIG